MASAAVLLDATVEAGIDPDIVGLAEPAPAESAAPDGETRQTPGDTSA